MSTLDELNRLLNRALRTTNEVATALPASPLSERKAALEAIVQAVVHLTSVQDLVVKQEPRLEYHYDPGRPPSQLMKDIAELFEQAEFHIAQGRIDEALQTLRRAKDMEPPPLTYELIAKKLFALRKD